MRLQLENGMGLLIKKMEIMCLGLYIYRSQRNKEFAVIFSFLGISIATPVESSLHD